MQLKEGFGEGLVKMQSLKKLLVIPVYKDEVSDRFYDLQFQHLLVLLQQFVNSAV